MAEIPFAMIQCLLSFIGLRIFLLIQIKQKCSRLLYLFHAWKPHDSLASARGLHESCHRRIHFSWADHYRFGHYGQRFNHAAYYANYDHLDLESHCYHLAPATSGPN